jgi:hypothetical protein
MVLAIHSHVFLRLASSRERPSSSSFTLQNKKKSIRARSGELEGGGSSWVLWSANHLFTPAAVWMGALFQWKNHSCWTIFGLFFFGFIKNLPKSLRE